MTCAYDETLTSIEQRGLSAGIAPEEIDEHVAEVLAVPPDHYAAWQLVAGAIASHAHNHEAVAAEAPAAGHRTVEGPVAEQLRRLWEHLGVIHHTAVSDGSQTVVREQARELIAELFALTDRLLAHSEPSSHLGTEGPGVDRD